MEENKREISIQFTFHHLYHALFTGTARYIDLWGGRARGGSHTATQYFLFRLTSSTYFRGCLLRAIHNDIRSSLWQDLKDRIHEAALPLADFTFNESMMTVCYLPTGNTIISKGFKTSSDSQSAKLKSLAGITDVLIEECEEVGEEEFTQLDDSIRTHRADVLRIIRLFNPPSKNHWLMKRYYNLHPSGIKGWYEATPKELPELLSIHSSFADNTENMHPSTIARYKAYGNPESPFYNADKYYRDVLGLVSEGRRGRILTRCKAITHAAFQALPYDSFYGLDFGYSADPVALTKLKMHNGNIYAHQLIYARGLTDDMLCTEMKRLGVSQQALIYADEAESKSIASIKYEKKYNIYAASKGQGSLLHGIKFLQAHDIHITDCSTDIWWEVQEYCWALDANKEPTNTPMDKHTHAIDSIRYAATSKKMGGGMVSTWGE